MSDWYLSYDGKKLGPFDLHQARAQAQQNPVGFAWKQGYLEWQAISQIAELQSGVDTSPPLPNESSADRIEFTIVGAEMQFVEVLLDAGESAIAEAGAMMYKDASVSMESVFGTARGGLVEKLVGVGKRVLSGESMFVTVFTHQGSGKGRVAFAAPYPGNILPVRLSNQNGSLICQKDSFLAAAKGVRIGVFFQRRILTGLFGGEGFIMQKLEGDGLVFLHAGGTVVERALKSDEVLHVDTGCIVAFDPTVQFDIEQAGNVKTLLFGGEGFFFARLRGPGKVWLQSLPFSRLVGRVLSTQARSRDESSPLGRLGRFFNGDKSY